MALLLQHFADLEYFDLGCNPVSRINSNYILVLITRVVNSSLVPKLEYLILDYNEDLKF